MVYILTISDYTSLWFKVLVHSESQLRDILSRLGKDIHIDSIEGIRYDYDGFEYLKKLQNDKKPKNLNFGKKREVNHGSN